MKDKKEILSLLTISMSKSEIFDINTISPEIRESLDDEIRTIIDSYNNYICSSTLLTSGTEKKYSDVIKENEDLSKEKNRLKEENKKLLRQIDDLKRQKEELECYKQMYNDFTNKVYNLVDDEKQNIKKRK